MRMIDTHSIYMFLKSLEAHGVTCDVNIECVGGEQIPGLHVTYQNKFKFFPTPLSALPWMQERYREDLTELLGDLALSLVEKDDKMSETPEQGALSAEQRLDVLKDIRWDLHQVAEKLQNRLAALDALKQAQAKVTKLIQDASRPK